MLQLPTAALSSFHLSTQIIVCIMQLARRKVLQLLPWSLNHQIPVSMVLEPVNSVKMTHSLDSSAALLPLSVRLKVQLQFQQAVAAVVVLLVVVARVNLKQN
jgi:hypothetical protein